MPDSVKNTQLHPVGEVIAKLYSAAIDGKNMPELFSAWDAFIDSVFKEDPEEARLWQSLLTEHFEQAGSLIIVDKPSLAEEKQAYVDKQAFPAILFNACFCLVAKNQQANLIWNAKSDSDISTAIQQPFEPQRLFSTEAGTSGLIDPVLVSLDIGEEECPQTVMAVIHPVEFASGDGTQNERLFMLRIARPRWYSKLERMLAKAYGLTKAELVVAKGLYKNRSLNEIAKDRSRSIRTVRTQLSNIFSKVGVSSQTELVGVVSSLGQILDVGESGKPTRGQSSRYKKCAADTEIRTCRSNEGHRLSYIVYGAKDGRPVLSIQPTVPPEMTARFRHTAIQAGLRFIAPYKPGSGQSSSRNYSYTPKIAAQNYKSILEAENIDQVDVIGVYSGGVYALHFANTFPTLVNKVVLVDTGVPLRPPGDFMKMSAGARRTFLPARYFAHILLTPHKMVAKEFHQSEQGEKRIVEYFFSGSPNDLEIVKNHSEYYDITRDMSSYSLSLIHI
jgi:DNA-binding CsgD family transcriptional regulator